MQRNMLVKVAAVVGTVLAGIPILAPAFFSIVSAFRGGGLRFDYLMPAELLPVALLGGVILLWAAWRARLRLKLVAWALGVGVLALSIGLGLAQVTGVANSLEEPPAALMALVIAPIIVYDLAVLVMFVAGILLTRGLFKSAS